MNTVEINIEKDFLGIFRKAGSYNNFKWFPADKFDEKSIRENIEKFNASPYRKTDGLVAEITTDKLVKEICAYKEQGKPLEDLIREARGIQESIDRATEYLETALENLNSITGLD
jgi:geranylgeranyl pyrophosphate synthase